MPALMAPSPITAMTLCVLPSRSRATAMPSPAEIEVEEWPAPNVSYSLSAAGEYLVGIGLVSDIPNELVGRGVEHMMERDGELDHAEAGAEMAAGHRDRGDQLLPQFLRQRLQLMVLKGAQIHRRLDTIEQRRRTLCAHSLYPADFWE